MYAIIDIETTGGSPKHEKITEIAIFIHDGMKVTQEFCSLINPEKYIPPYITSLTGISNEMVEDAPKFFEVAKKIVELTQDCVFVAHNASFDYNFVKSEFRQLGYDYERKTLCTVRLSRKLLPGYKSYSLGNLCNSLNIQINGRHRAAGDALATVKLFELLKETNESAGAKISFSSNREGKYKNLNGYTNPADIDRIPEEIGVYYLHDSEGNLIYIGKSKNIYTRILSHFGANSSRKADEMKARVAGISYELTGSELIALLKESNEIKEHKPLYNKAQRRSILAWGLYSFHDQKGYLNFRLKKVSDENRVPITGFSSKTEALKILSSFAEKYWLCQKLCGLYETEGACFHYDIRQCNGACFGKEAVKTYNDRAEKLIRTFDFDAENFIIIDKGRNHDERSVVCVEHGIYRGYGFISIHDSYVHVSDLTACITHVPDNRDARMIIKGWLKKNKPEKLIRF
jgi:DNA polymerase III subunit epsilon